MKEHERGKQRSIEKGRKTEVDGSAGERGARQKASGLGWRAANNQVFISVLGERRSAQQAVRVSLMTAPMRRMMSSK